MNRPNLSLDLPFNVPQVHRLRTTDDVTGKDYEVLTKLLDCGETQCARVLLVGEHALAPRVESISRRLRGAARVDLVADPLLVEGGEVIKNGEVALRMLLDKINDYGLDRRSYIIAVGGGALLDAVGFAAAIAHRGVRLIRLPSTVLAQADSGVGVKNAINYFQKKNWIGSFAVPWAVINDAALLETLPERDFVSGFSEAIKVALLKDRDEFDWLCDNAAKIRGRDPLATKHAITRSCELHLQHITQGGDPFEMLEARPLDFGHWSAHRLEPLTGYKLRHGEAVAIGVAIDCHYSALKHGFNENDAVGVCRFLTDLGIELWNDAIKPIDRLLQGLEEFRQHLGGRLTITMLDGVARPINVHEIDHDAMIQAVQQVRSFAVAAAN